MQCLGVCIAVGQKVVKQHGAALAGMDRESLLSRRRVCCLWECRLPSRCRFVQVQQERDIAARATAFYTPICDRGVGSNRGGIVRTRAPKAGFTAHDQQGQARATAEKIGFEHTITSVHVELRLDH